MENELIKLGVIKEVKVTSLQVAELTRTEHKNVLAKARKMMEELGGKSLGNFTDGSYNNSQNKQQPMIIFSEQSVKTLLSTYNLCKSDLSQVYNSLGLSDIEVMYSRTRFEDSFEKQLKDTLLAIDIELETQKLVCNNKYFIDFYLPKYNIAIEYDEEQHNIKNNKNNDKIRQKEIENKIECNFIRLDYKNTDAYNIGLIIKKLFKLKGAK